MNSTNRYTNSIPYNEHTDAAFRMHPSKDFTGLFDKNLGIKEYVGRTRTWVLRKDQTYPYWHIDGYPFGMFTHIRHAYSKIDEIENRMIEEREKELNATTTTPTSTQDNTYNSE